MILLAVAALLAPLAQANDLNHLPRSFTTDGKKSVFVDMASAVYDIQYTQPNGALAGSARVVAEITFQNVENGYPVFDSQSEPSALQLDGHATTATLIATPDQATLLRRIEISIAPGTHVLRVEVPITQQLEFSATGVQSGFWMTDLTDRGYLERYLPTNFLFDRIKMKLRIRFIGAAASQKIYSNGVVRAIDSQNFEVEYPDYFTSTSPFFHTTPANSVNEHNFDYTMASGRTLPVTVYTAAGVTSAETLDQASRQIRANLAAMEKDFGDFPHPTLTVFIAKGGMEYSGATMTSMGALSHELFHSYFARAVMPSDGNAGWIDEALAVWHDVGYDSLGQLQGFSMMANHPYYTRSTDTDAYSFGKDFMSYLNGKLAAQGGLKPFLNHLLKNRVFAPMTTEEFVAEMSAFYHLPLEAEFRKYVYGTKAHEDVEEATPDRLN